MKEKYEYKYLVAPLISIIAFLLLLGGASYAYYTQTIGSSTGAANIANANLTVSRGCTFLSNATNCTILANTGTSTNFTDNYISRAEMSQTYAGNSIAKSSCNLNIGVQGTAGCTCNYTVKLLGDVTTNYIAGSLKFTITSTNTSHSLTTETSMGPYATTGQLTVATTGTAVYENMAVNLKAYNINSNQNNQAGINYVYYLEAEPICSVANTGLIGRIYWYGASESHNVGDNISVLNGHYATSGTAVDYSSYGINMTHYIRLDVANDIIIAAYACKRVDNVEACVKAGSGNYGTYTGMSGTTVTSVTGATGNIKRISYLQNNYGGTDGHGSYNSTQSSFCVDMGPDECITAYSNGNTQSQSLSNICYANANGSFSCG